MAFTASEKGKIRAFLGYSELYPDFQTTIRSAIDLVGADAEATAEVQTLLTRISAVDTALDVDALDIAGLASVGAGDPEFFKNAKIKDLRSIGRGLIRKLSIKMGVQPIQDYFGTGSNSSGPITYFG